MFSWKLGCHSISAINLFFMVLLDLQMLVLRHLSELSKPAAASSSNVSNGTDDRNPVLTAKHI